MIDAWRLKGHCGVGLVGSLFARRCCARCQKLWQGGAARAVQTARSGRQEPDCLRSPRGCYRDGRSKSRMISAQRREALGEPETEPIRKGSMAITASSPRQPSLSCIGKVNAAMSTWRLTEAAFYCFIVINESRNGP